jgi:phage/plasmid-associated DNA primase
MDTFKLAKILYSIHSDTFVCSSIKSNEWWEFKNHKWNKISTESIINIFISKDFCEKYNIEINDKIINKIIKDTKCLFFDSNFIEKLDTNCDLIGFENGVYDLENKIFRNGIPNDFISLSTKNHYIYYSDDILYLTKILEFFELIFPNNEARKIFLQILSICVSGKNKEKKLYILTGSNLNSNLLILNLLYTALGDYYLSCPLSLIIKPDKTFNKISPEKVRLKGKRCGVFQEIDDNDKIDIGTIKEFIDDREVLVRDLFKGSNEMIQYKPQLKCFITCNHLPAILSNDEILDKLKIIDINYIFSDKKINEINQEIKNWAPAFLSYLIHMYNLRSI